MLALRAFRFTEHAAKLAKKARDVNGPICFRSGNSARLPRRTLSLTRPRPNKRALAEAGTKARAFISGLAHYRTFVQYCPADPLAPSPGRHRTPEMVLTISQRLLYLLQLQNP